MITPYAKESCPILLRLPFAPPQGSSIDVATAVNELHFTYLSTALLAIDHINERNGSIVPEFSSDSFARCNFSVSEVVVQNTKPDTAPYLLDDDTTSTYLQGHDSDSVTDASECSNPIVAIGPIHGDAIVDTAWENMNIPNISISDSYSNNVSYLNTVNSIPSFENSAGPLLEYIQNTIHRDYITFLYVNNTDGIGFMNAVNLENKRHGLTIESYAFTLGKKFEDSLSNAFESTVKTRFTTIVFFPPLEFDYGPFVRSINSFMLNEDNFLWIVVDRFMGAFFQTATDLEYEKDSWLNGLALYSPKVESGLDFAQSFSMLDDRMVDHTRLASPAKFGHTGYYHAPYNLFDTLKESTCFEYSLGVHAHLYDVVASSVLGYCLAKQGTCDNGSEHSTCEISSENVINAILSTRFAGASGNFSIEQNSLKFEYEIWNVRTNLQTNQTPITFSLSHEMIGNVWRQVDSFIYRDETLYPPSRLRLVDKRTLSTSDIWKNFTNIISVVGILTCFTLTIIVRTKEDSDIIQQSMPFFLYGICACSSLLFLSVALHNLVNAPCFDVRGVDFACELKVALRTIGFHFGLSFFLIKTGNLNERLLSNHHLYVGNAYKKIVWIYTLLYAVSCLIAVGGTPVTFHCRDGDFDDYNFPTAQYGVCAKMHSAPYHIAFSLSAFLALYVFAFSYKVKRTLQEQDELSTSRLRAYGEVKDVFLSVAFQCFIISVSTIFLFLFDFLKDTKEGVLCFQINPGLIAISNMWFTFRPIMELRQQNDIHDNQGSQEVLSIPSLLDLPMLARVRQTER